MDTNLVEWRFESALILYHLLGALNYATACLSMCYHILRSSLIGMLTVLHFTQCA
jgi:hypothetical protein